MIFVTGDTHGFYDSIKLEKFVEATPGLTKDDYVIIAGDFGGLWFPKDLENDLDRFSAFPFTTLFVDGNHENFDLLDKFPVEEFCGGKVHRIRKDIIHLMRGEVYFMQGKTFFTMGGATSIDREYRREHISWWKEECPTLQEIEYGIKNLQAVNKKVDYIITHSCDEKTLYYPPLINRSFQAGIYPENLMLSRIEAETEYAHWYFGHYHDDADITAKKTLLYNRIIRLV